MYGYVHYMHIPYLNKWKVHLYHKSCAKMSFYLTIKPTLEVNRKVSTYQGITLNGISSRSSRAVGSVRTNTQ